MPGNDQGVGARARGQERKGKDVSAASSYPALIELLPPFYRVRNKHRPVRNSGKSNIPSRACPLPNRKFSPDNHLEKVNDFPSNILRKTGPKMYVQTLVRLKLEKPNIPSRSSSVEPNDFPSNILLFFFLLFFRKTSPKICVCPKFRSLEKRKPDIPSRPSSAKPKILSRSKRQSSRKSGRFSFEHPPLPLLPRNQSKNVNVYVCPMSRSLERDEPRRRRRCESR